MVGAPRYSDCVDCHEPHLVEKDAPTWGCPGGGSATSSPGSRRSTKLCYRCHADVVSLKAPYAVTKEKPGEISIISCGDCHGSDGDGGAGGAHGSNYRGLLRYHYEMEEGRAESEFAYALCCRCHERSSILGNESFPLHSRHIEGNRDRGQGGDSCFTCHGVEHDRRAY